ncbi:Rv2578c family radical SAM protein [Xylanimonas sp. McL0601]|uniref:Rv2578c family radical SAM protein n=1 Tax=Xylanimonas sp. McL0601 TaxID=3414739 RepID=UPI003CF5A481
MRWDGQAITADEGTLPGLDRPALERAGLLRSVQTPEFAGITFHEVAAKSALSHLPAVGKMPFQWTINPYRGCSHACTYCASPDTPVLMADGTELPIGALEPGDAIVGTRVVEGAPRYVVTHVVDRWRARKPAYRIELSDGGSLTTSGDHRFLAEDGWRYVGRGPSRTHVLRDGVGLRGPGRDGITSGTPLIGHEVARDAAVKVESVTFLGSEPADLVDITTGTGDFIADGVISHNCFARPTHEYLDLDAGKDFDTQVIVKTNVAEVLRVELAKTSWTHEPVALGTNTDPYQRAEGRYRLMTGIIEALADSGTPFSILTKGTLLRRDLSLIVDAATKVEVGLGVSIAFADTPEAHALQHAVEPGTPSPRARLDLVRTVRDAGLPCGVMVAPVLPWLTDSTGHLMRLLDQIAEAGATGVTVMALHLKPGTREWYLGWLEREHPDLAAGYGRVFARGTYALKAYQEWLKERVRPMLEERGFGSAGHRVRSGATGRYHEELRAREARGGPSAGALPGLPTDGTGLQIAGAGVEQVLF